MEHDPWVKFPFHKTHLQALALARLLDCTIEIAIALLVEWWRWCNVNLHRKAQQLPAETIDAAVGRKGFANALADPSVKLLKPHKDGRYTVEEYDLWFGWRQKVREQGRKRSQKCRERKRETAESPGPNSEAVMRHRDARGEQVRAVGDENPSTSLQGEIVVEADNSDIEQATKVLAGFTAFDPKLFDRACAMFYDIKAPLQFIRRIKKQCRTRELTAERAARYAYKAIQSEAAGEQPAAKPQSLPIGDHACP